MDQTFALIAGLGSLFAFGLIVALLGSVKLKLAPKIQADNAQFGKIVSVLQIAMVVMAIVAGIALDNLGFRLVIMMGGLTSAIAIFLIGAGNSRLSVAAACVLMGIGGQFVNVAGNTLAPRLFTDKAAGSNVGNTFFGLGAFLIPIIAAQLLKRMSIRRALCIVSVFALIPAIVAFLGTFPTEEKSFNVAMIQGLLENIVTWIAAVTLFCYIGLEVSMATWITTYASDLGADHSAAGNTLSIFFVFMMISRLIFGLQGQVTHIDLTPNGAYILCGLAILAALVITSMAAAKTLRRGRIAVGAAGFLFGPIFPTTIGVTFQHFEPSQYGTLFGLIFAIGLLGATFLPAWIGTIAKGKSVRQGLRVLTVTAIILAGLSLVLGWLP